MDEIVQQKIDKLAQDIETIKVQGATNVALATLEGMEIVANASQQNEPSKKDLLVNIEQVGYRLATARQNEPLARNAVRYVLSHVTGENLSDEIKRSIQKFKELLKDAKIKIKDFAEARLAEYDVVMTHCHSSTATEALIEATKTNPDLKVVVTETRPLYQGRKTAKELVEAGIDVTMIVDSASASFIVDDRYLPVEAVIVGCDELHVDGKIINKVGSYQIALAVKNGGDEFFVVTTLLKIDPTAQAEIPQIEMRSAREVWEDAPEELKIINPAFEIVSAELITGYITEAGILSKDELLPKLKELYNWL